MEAFASGICHLLAGDWLGLAYDFRDIGLAPAKSFEKRNPETKIYEPCSAEEFASGVKRALLAEEDGQTRFGALATGLGGLSGEYKFLCPPFIILLCRTFLTLEASFCSVLSSRAQNAPAGSSTCFRRPSAARHILILNFSPAVSSVRPLSVRRGWRTWWTRTSPSTPRPSPSPSAARCRPRRRRASRRSARRCSPRRGSSGSTASSSCWWVPGFASRALSSACSAVWRSLAPSVSRGNHVCRDLNDMCS